MLGLWRTFSSPVLYVTLLLGLGGLMANGFLLWTLGLHGRKGPFSVYVLHLAAADSLFLACQVGFSVAEAALGSRPALAQPLSFLWFCVGLGLLAFLGAERFLSDVFPACYGRCWPRHASAALCVLAWALTPAAVLLPARACGQLGGDLSLLPCLRAHVAGVAWVACLATTAGTSGLGLLLWVGCCSPRPPPRLYGVLLGSVLLLGLCGLPFLLCCTFPGLLSLLPPSCGPVARLLSCVHCGSRPLLYYAEGRRRGQREPLRVTLHRVLGGEAEPGTPGPALPLRLL